MTEFVNKLVSVVPSERQIKWQETEFYAFIHYGINQFTNREWGTGNESPSIFNPQKLDTDQWCACVKMAGMRGIIITAKHHDGFCLWDTKHTRHSTMYSPYGKDIVAQLASSCAKHALKLGIYLSPWDRHDSRYGQGEPYDAYFCAQLGELLTNYGEIFCVWLDGACGEGANGKAQVYDWQRYYALIRELQPGAVISVCGPDVRWCGNEAGHCRKNEWSVVPRSMIDNEAIRENSQQADDAAFRRRVPSEEQDLGSRQALIDYDKKGHGELAWYPAEVNTSIRPGWFYHAEEDDKVRSLEELASIYIQSVGGNATFLLNVPPHPQGYIAAQDANRLAEFGRWLEDSFRENLLTQASFTASNQSGELNEQWVMAETAHAISPHFFVLQEEIRESQRIEEFCLLYWNGAAWTEACSGGAVGYKRICRLRAAISSNKWMLRIPASRGPAVIKTFALY